MRVNSSQGWAIKVESPAASSKVFDQLAVSMNPGPVIHFSVGMVGITDVPDDDTYVIGFIQFITKYLFQAAYQDGLLEIKPKLPINDSDENALRPLSPTQVAVKDPFFYDAPTRVMKKADGPKQLGHVNFTNYTITAGDAPNFEFPLFHDDNPKNPLQRILRLHEFETWAVIWNLKAGTIEKPLVRFVWEHHVDAVVDPGKKPGQRVELRKCYSRELEVRRQVDAAIRAKDNSPATIPDVALRAPTANSETPRQRFYRDIQVLPPAALRRSQ